MANAHITTPTYNTDANSTSVPPHASPRANPDTQPENDSDVDIGLAADSVRENGDDSLVSPLEAAIEEERSRLRLADSVLDRLQIALNPGCLCGRRAADQYLYFF